MKWIGVATLTMTTCLAGCTNPQTACNEKLDALNLSQVRYVTVHNAYHIAPAATALEFVRDERIELYPGFSPERAATELTYSHPPLEVQLDAGIRAFELDVWNDPEGGQFSQPAIRRLVAGLPAPSSPGELDEPGLKTLHIPDFDYLSQCPRFIDCLATVADWSREHPDHLPIFILVEAKDGIGADLGPQAPSRETALFDEAAFARLHDEILAVLVPEEVILPSEVSGAGIWPTVGNTRGRIAFMLFDYGDDIARRYAQFAYTTDSGPLLHLNNQQTELAATWRRSSVPAKIDRGDFQGLIYTKADTTNVVDLERREQALRSSANFLATDFPWLGDVRSPDGVSFSGALVSPSCDPGSR